MRALIKDEPILQIITESQGYDDIPDYLEATVGFVERMEDQYGKVFKVCYIEEGSYVDFSDGYAWPIEAVILMED